MKPIAIIFGYNNTRINDIRRLQGLCRELLNAEILLCKDDISDADKAITPYTLAIELVATNANAMQTRIQTIDEYLQTQALKPVACLPFSDKGVPIGSAFAAAHNLPHDANGQAAEACLDKYVFRQLEKNTPTPDWYKKPVFAKVTSFKHAEMLLQEAGSALFFKPTSEGNSRGCIRIETNSELQFNEALLNTYIKQGVIAEECIDHCREYSYDSINGQAVITEKQTSTGMYRIEYQQVCPAPLDAADYNRLLEAGRIVSKIIGSKGGAEHHEFLFNPQTKHVVCVEPNRRPAGQDIWDWIAQAYANTDYWRAWVKWAGGIANDANITGAKQGYAGTHLITGQVNGKITAINEAILQALDQQPGIVKIKRLKSIDDSVENAPADNSGFIAQIACRHTSYAGLVDLFTSTANTIQSAIKVEAT